MPSVSPSIVAGVSVVFEDQVVAGTSNIKIEAPVGVMPVIIVALQPSAVEARVNMAMLPEDPTMRETVRADPVVGLDAQAAHAVADIGIDANVLCGAPGGGS